MKRYLLLLLGIMIAAIAMASDVITKKNGTTIQCKVTEVGSTLVKYKRATNLNGPDYTIDLSEISNIKYENGSVDNFGESSVIAANSGQRTMTDAELLRMYRGPKHPGRGWKTTGYVLGGIGLVPLIAGIIDTSDGFTGEALGIAYLGVGTGCYFIGRHKAKKAERYLYSSLFEQDFQLGNNTLLTADVNMINDNISHDKSLGLGLRFTF